MAEDAGVVFVPGIEQLPAIVNQLQNDMNDCELRIAYVVWLEERIQQLEAFAIGIQHDLASLKATGQRNWLLPDH